MADRMAVVVEHEGKATGEGALDAEGAYFPVKPLESKTDTVQRLLQQAGDLAPQPFKLPILTFQDSQKQPAANSGEFADQTFQILLTVIQAGLQETLAGNRRLSCAIDPVRVLMKAGGGLLQDPLPPSL